MIKIKEKVIIMRVNKKTNFLEDVYGTKKFSSLSQISCEGLIFIF